MRRKLFLWIYPPYLVTVVLSAIAFTVFTAQSATDFFFDLSSLELRETAKLTANVLEPMLGSELAPETGEDIRSWCDRLVRGTAMRLTVIEPDGRVIADTGSRPETMDIHLDREEVREAMERGAGSAVRKSVSTGIITTYEALALRGEDGQTVAILRTSMPFSIIGSRRGDLVLRILVFGLCLATAVSLIAVLLARRLSGPILRIHAGAQAFSAGRLDERIPEDGPLEVANLAAVMNRMATDLDGRIRTVREQKNQVEAILNGMSESVAVVDEELVILKSNPAFKRLFGDSEGISLLSLTRNTELCSFMDAAIRTDGPLETGITVYGERPRQLRLVSTPFENGKAVLVINDLTHLNRLETLRRDFTANVSHELKTPITAIKAALETLRDGDFSDPNESSRFLDMASRGTERLESIIEDLLSLARIEEEEKKGIEPKKVELDTVIASVLEEIAPRAAERGQRVERTGAEGLAVSGHAGLIRQALANLLDNALKYGGDKGAVTVSTSTDRGFAVLSVTDQGPGIPEKDRMRVFERFYRLDKARSRESGGTGLGLAIVKHIAQAHSGSVRLESVEGKGSTFSILLPLAEK